MASLALIVSLIFFSMLMIGPVSLCLAYMKRVPTVIVQIISLISISFGLWWIFTLSTSIGIVGLVPVICGMKAISYRGRSLHI